MVHQNRCTGNRSQSADEFLYRLLGEEDLFIQQHLIDVNAGFLDQKSLRQIAHGAKIFLTIFLDKDKRIATNTSLFQDSADPFCFVVKEIKFVYDKNVAIA